MARGPFAAMVRGAETLVRDSASSSGDDSLWNGMWWSTPSATGIQINQQTALQASVVMACVRILAEDVSKMTPRLYSRIDLAGYEKGARRVVKNHPLAKLLERPNDWQTWQEFARQMVVAFVLRGNAYAVILRNRRGDPVMLVPINPDRVQLWEAPDGGLFWMVTRAGLHELWVLRNEPFLIPYEDVFHLKDLSANGLTGSSPIALAREAIGLALAQEQQYARLMGNGARPGGILTTDRPLSDKAAERVRDDWNKLNQGLVNSGRTAILEQGLKWQPISINAVDLQFLQLRQFQIGEICRIFRVPPHMVGDLSRGTFNNIVQQAQEYRNNTLTSHSDIWEARFKFTFDLGPDLFVELDPSVALKADLTARYNAYRVGILTGFVRRNEARIAEGLDPDPDAEALLYPSNELESGTGSDLGGDNPGAGGPKANVDIDNEPLDAAPGM